VIEGIQEIYPYAVNFTVVVCLLFVLLKNPLKKFVYQRHERMRDAVETAAAAHKAAAAREKSAKQALAAFATEESAMLARETAAAEQEKREIIEKAQAEGQRVLKEAERLASVEQGEASDKVKEAFLELVLQETEQRLKSGLKKDDHSAILKRAQNSIEVSV